MTCLNLTKDTIRKKSYVKFLKELCASKKYVCFYGCGQVFFSMLNAWQERIGRQIDFICDRNPDKIGKKFNGIPCVSLKELELIKDDSVVFVTTGAVVEVSRHLREHGFKNVYPVYKFDMYAEQNLKGTDIAAVKDKISKVYDILADNRSKDVLNAVCQRIFELDQNAALMSSVQDEFQYFVPDIFNFSVQEVFVDIGAYDGDTILEFLQCVNGCFGHIYAFELDKRNFRCLKDNIAPYEKKSGHITFYNMGCWDSPQIIKYSSADASSAIGNGYESGTVDRLDTILGPDAPVTFIKMDVEGAEMNVLRGAENIIKLHKPKMAVCVYHNVCHLYEVPLFLKELVPEYKIYMRHHSPYEYETICYAAL